MDSSALAPQATRRRSPSIPSQRGGRPRANPASTASTSCCCLLTLAVAIAAKLEPSLRPDRDRVPLPNRMLEVEPDRASTLQPNSLQLGGRAACEPGTPSWLSFAAPRLRLAWSCRRSSTLAIIRLAKKVSDADMAALNIEHHPICPTWNYTIRPRNSGSWVTELQELIL